jgi:hypothetical protein
LLLFHRFIDLSPFSAFLTSYPTVGVEDEKLDVDMDEKEICEKDLNEKEVEEEIVIREKAPLLAEKTGFEGIREISRIVREGGS